MKNLIHFFAVLFLSTNLFAQGEVINVPADQPTIQEAINASVDGDTVLVADGLYYENINYRGKAITVASWFLIDGDETHIDSTIINGSQPTHPHSGVVVEFNSGEDTTSVLYGFTITGGTGQLDPYGYGTRGAGGIAINSSGAKIQYNKITGNVVTHNASAEGGGIIINANSNDVLILDNYITNNEVLTSVSNGEGGGGIFIYSSNNSATIANNVIANNIVSRTDGSPTGGGGGILLKSSKVLLKNNLIKNNKAFYGGGLEFDDFPGSTELLFINNTVVNNEAVMGGGYCGVDAEKLPQIYNSIFWGNTASTSPQFYYAPVIRYSNVQGGRDGTGNIDQDPMFADTVNFNLDPSSPCVDAGFPLTMYYDVENPNNPSFPLFPALGNMRNDMGCYGGNPNMLNATPPEAIVDVRIDSDTSGVPDRKDEVVTTTGIVTSINFQKNSGDLGFYIQDETAGIFVFANNDDSTNFVIGDWVEVHGAIDQYNGLAEIIVDNTEKNLVLLEHNHTVVSKTLFADELLKNPEKYEGMVVRINALKKSSGDWPTTNTSTNLEVTDGYKTLTIRLDDDTDLGNTPEPIYPINLVGLVSQNTSSEPAVDGYQLMINSSLYINQNVQAAPSPYFFFTPDSKDNENGDYGVTHPSVFTVSLEWYSAKDLNNDALTYEVAVIRDDGVIVEEGPSDNGGTGKRTSRTNAQLIDFVQKHGENNTFTGSWVIRVTDGNTGIVASVDTLKNFTLNDLYTVDVDDESTLPKEFALAQNYPNPFNPSTTIKYEIPSVASDFSLSNVTLKVYDILGREVATLVNKQQKAGYYEVNWNASNNSSGVYFYKLNAGSFVETKKMILLR